MGVFSQLVNYIFPSDTIQQQTLVRDVWMNCFPERIILWNYLITRFHPVKIDPVYYIGAIAGAEFLTYDAKKIYMALDLNFLNVDNSVVPSYVELDDVGGVIPIARLGNSYPYWDTTAVHEACLSSNYNIKDVWFTILNAVLGYTYMKFSGYRFLLQ